MLPICPKCRKEISEKNYSRHLRRCGVRHKHAPSALDHPENFYMKIWAPIFAGSVPSARN